jgi:imidazolonepropionase-like amidohydrolase
MILQVAKDFGFQVRTLQHVLEGYRVAPEIAAAGTGASTFSDWWSYKAEAWEAIPFNAALMTRSGVLVSINSDSDEQIRHLNVEAAKTIKYGGLTEREALATITANPARQLGIEKHAGIVAVGLDGDLAVYNGHPLSPYSRCVLTLVDGEIRFDRRDAPNHSTPGFKVEDRIRRAPAPLPKGDTIAIVDALINPALLNPFRGTIVFSKGKITAMGPGVRPPKDAEIIEGAGLSVYPGLIDAHTYLGLAEIGSVAGMRDDAEIGGIQPDLKALTAVNPHSDLIPVTRAAGITTVLTAPHGGLIAGQSAVVRLDGWIPKDMAVKEVYALHVNFPVLGGTEETKADDEKKMKELREPFEAARRYRPGDRDLKLEALLPYLNKERRVVFEANRVPEIRGAIKFAEEFGLLPVISGGREAWKVASMLAEKKVPVILGGVLEIPYERHDPYDAAFANPARLAQAGVKFAISSAESFAGNMRNTPYHAAWAAAYGLDRAEALRAVTLYPAQILGVADRIGSLGVGMEADLIVTTGDPLEVITDVVYEFIRGRAVPLETKHTRSYEKFKQRPK